MSCEKCDGTWLKATCGAVYVHGEHTITKFGMKITCGGMAVRIRCAHT
jgi:hypothetical protein